LWLFGTVLVILVTRRLNVVVKEAAWSRSRANHRVWYRAVSLSGLVTGFFGRLIALGVGASVLSYGVAVDPSN
jgi:hypothetical protein